MKKLLWFIATVAFAQTWVYNPLTSQLEYLGPGIVRGSSSLATTGAVPYVASPGVLTSSDTFLFSAGSGISAASLIDGASQSTQPNLIGKWSTGNVKWQLGATSDSVAAMQVMSAAGSSIFHAARVAGVWQVGAVESAPLAFVVGGTERARIDTSGRLGIGIAPAYTLDVNGGIRANGIDGLTNSDLSVNSGSGYAFAVKSGGTELARFAATTGNLLLATTTDGGYKLDVSGTGANGTLRVYDATLSSGSTKAVIRAGAGQSGNLLEVQNSAGTVTARNIGGAWETSSYLAIAKSSAFSSYYNAVDTTGFVMALDRGVYYSSTTDTSGTKDLSLSRNAAGILQVGDGGSNANGTVLASMVKVGSGVGYLQHNKGDASQSGYVGFHLADTTRLAYIGYGTLNVHFPFVLENASSGLRVTQNSGAATSIQGWYTSTDSMMDLSASGTLSLYNQKATTGSTKLTVRAGQGQSTTLQEWQNNAGTVLASVSALGIFSLAANQWHGDSAGVNRLYFAGSSSTYIKGPAATGTIVFRNSTDVSILSVDSTTRVKIPSVSVFGWTDTSNAETGTLDIGFYRSAAGVVGINSGSGTTGGGLLIESLKSTTGTRYVCVDTTGRFTSSATACSGT